MLNIKNNPNITAKGWSQYIEFIFLEMGQNLEQLDLSDSWINVDRSQAISQQLRRLLEASAPQAEAPSVPQNSKTGETLVTQKTIELQKVDLQRQHLTQRVSALRIDNLR